MGMVPHGPMSSRKPKVNRNARPAYSWPVIRSSTVAISVTGIVVTISQLAPGAQQRLERHQVRCDLRAVLRA
jgi:hypothetical protein